MTNQRKNNRIGYAQLIWEDKGKGNYLRGGAEREEAVLLGQFYKDRLQRENKLDTDEDRMSQIMRRSQRIKTDWQRQIEIKQRNSGEAQREREERWYPGDWWCQPGKGVFSSGYYFFSNTSDVVLLTWQLYTAPCSKLWVEPRAQTSAILKAAQVLNLSGCRAQRLILFSLFSSFVRQSVFKNLRRATL